MRWRLWCLLIVVGKVTGGEVESGAAVRGGRRKARTARSLKKPASLRIGRVFRGADALLFGQSGPFLVEDCALAVMVAADCDG
ncbi:hypothetical protein CBI35_15530 [Pantoea sp. AV62]|nr:hypothetical protein HA39_10570 [Pantoea brenneri]OXM22098.1 hypothetical protein CBI35_15530 [Pantoea sp. AV62]